MWPLAKVTLLAALPVFFWTRAASKKENPHTTLFCAQWPKRPTGKACEIGAEVRDEVHPGDCCLRARPLYRQEPRVSVPWGGHI